MNEKKFPMAWGTYMLRKSFVLVIIRFRVKARENPFRFEMIHRTPGNPTTVNTIKLGCRTGALF
jgi:hypothetical protein